MICNAERLLSLNNSYNYNKRSLSHSRFARYPNVTFGSNPMNIIDQEVEKVKAKHRKDVMYIKKNMNRRFKRIIKEVEDQAKSEIDRQEESHKRAVFKITKNWNSEKATFEEKNKYLEQENNFLRNENNEYKQKHDLYILEIERLKKYIDDLEDENEAYKQHIAARMNYDAMHKISKCEECLQTDNQASLRKTHKDVGISMKSSILTNDRQNSFPNLVTLEPNFGTKSIHISTAREYEPLQDLQRRSFYFNDPMMSKVMWKIIILLERLSTKFYWNQKYERRFETTPPPKINGSTETKRYFCWYAINHYFADLEEQKDIAKVNESKSNSWFQSIRDEKEKTEDLTPPRYMWDLR